MTLRTRRLRRIELIVGDLAAAERFYVEALGFTAGAREGEHVTLDRGGQALLLRAYARPGRPKLVAAAANDQAFQHFAMPVVDMTDAMDRLRAFAPDAISTGGPQHLPRQSGGATAYKFRDPDGHPLELIEFADHAPGGIDHSAIVVADVERSIAFYRDTLGFRVSARQLNVGPEQERLDGLDGAVVEVVALQPDNTTPHIELLAYSAPAVRLAAPALDGDLPSTRLVLEVTGLGEARRILHDPDGHLLVLQQG